MTTSTTRLDQGVPTLHWLHSILLVVCELVGHLLISLTLERYHGCSKFSLPQQWKHARLLGRRFMRLVSSGFESFTFGLKFFIMNVIIFLIQVVGSITIMIFKILCLCIHSQGFLIARLSRCTCGIIWRFISFSGASHKISGLIHRSDDVIVGSWRKLNIFSKSFQLEDSYQTRVSRGKDHF